MRAHLIIAITFSSVIAAAADLIPNASFENPGFNDPDPFIIVPAGNYITGWTVGGAGVDYFSNLSNALFASEGQYSVNYIRGPGDVSSISTTITGLTAGVAYDVSVDFFQRDPGATNALTATVDFTSLTFINNTSDVWQTRDLNFIAGGPTATLTFSGPSQGAVDSVYAHIDNVRIAAVPEPSTYVLLGIAALVVARTKKLRR
ncbi:MAG: hypothetical protein QOG48_1109 [Verrucomicrobiota bacterium]|jgi:hypothetical protein